MDLNKLSDKDYNEYVKKKAAPSPLGKNLAWAFTVGGGICVAGQALLDFYRSRGLDEAMAGTAVSVTLIALTALLTGLGVFDRIAKRAGAGTLVPITGFANAVAVRHLRQRGLRGDPVADKGAVAPPFLDNLPALWYF